MTFEYPIQGICDTIRTKGYPAHMPSAKAVVGPDKDQAEALTQALLDGPLSRADVLAALLARARAAAAEQLAAPPQVWSWEDKQLFANAAEEAVYHPLVRDVCQEYVDNMKLNGHKMDGFPTIMLDKIATYAAQVARAQALSIDPQVLVS